MIQPTIGSTVSSTVLQMEALAGAFAGMTLVFFLVFVVVPIAGMWKIFTKAGKPGWAAIVPIYNLYVTLQIIDRPAWWLVLMIIPVVNFVIGFLVLLELAGVYGKGAGYAIGMFILPFVFIPLLGFGSAQYEGVAA